MIATALQHVCLIARIDHPLDPSPRDPNDIETPLPGVERHWAQRNIAVISPGADGSVDFTFAGANPFWKEEAFVFEVKPLQRERLQQLARSVRADPVEVAAMNPNYIDTVRLPIRRFARTHDPLPIRFFVSEFQLLGRWSTGFWANP